jgi:predicted nucleic acid-binding protein
MASFVDTNILIYAFLGDLNGSTVKPAIADALIADLIRKGERGVSTTLLPPNSGQILDTHATNF